VRSLFRNHGLSIVTFALFLLFMGGQTVTGFLDYNAEQTDHGEPAIALGEYLTSGSFLEATMENWESEFLQMGSFVVLTAVLHQKGSAESKDPDGRDPVDRDPRRSRRRNAPYPVKRGGVMLWLYERSLGLTFFILFAITFILHAIGGAEAYSEEELLHGGAPVTTIQYLETSRFWFESFQNWQSEYLSVLAMVVFTIFLRQRGSPESKPVDEPSAETGAE
jgi:hypothetical protein